jgi:nitroimidazol reductase NimA-like FMN-containing flavoprotein (pyridoxamine 5'-phosphate oxidase superfamily)
MTMFREMRRKGQQLSEEESVDILRKATSGVLSVIGDEGYPYGVPVSFVYHEGKIYIHSALKGHKIDSIRNHHQVSFCTIVKDEIIPERFTTHFRSVIAFGKAEILQEEGEKLAAIRMIADKYSPSIETSKREEEIEKTFAHLCIIVINIEHLTGKEAIELVNEKKKTI